MTNDMSMCFWPTGAYQSVNTVNFSSSYFALASDDTRRAFLPRSAASDFTTS